MTLCKKAAICAAFFVGIGFYAQDAEAAKFTGSEFLKLSDDDKKMWTAGAVYSLSAFIVSKDKKQGQCIYDWYFKDKSMKLGLIVVSAKRYPEHSYAAILFALIKRGCGDYPN